MHIELLRANAIFLIATGFNILYSASRHCDAERQVQYQCAGAGARNASQAEPESEGATRGFASHQEQLPHIPAAFIHWYLFLSFAFHFFSNAGL